MTTIYYYYNVSETKTNDIPVLTAPGTAASLPPLDAIGLLLLAVEWLYRYSLRLSKNNLHVPQIKQLNCHAFLKYGRLSTP